MDMNEHDYEAKTKEYLTQAAKACSGGDVELGMHLYIAAFEESLKASGPSDEALNGMRMAWTLACNAGERSLAEHIFEKLEPYLTNDEAPRFAEELQALTLDKLEAMGFPRAELEGMANLVGEGIAHMSVQPLPPAGALRKPKVAPPGKKAEETEAPEIILAEAPPTYKDLVGYAKAIRDARELGIGRKDTPGYDMFIGMLNTNHGLMHSPAEETLVICSPAREDASQFLDATVGELGQSTMRMRIEESIHGFQTLCIVTPKDGKLRYDQKHGEFKGSGVLVLEDFDLWTMPSFESEDEFGYFMMAQMSRGAREALAMIHHAIKDPLIRVVVSMSSESDLDPFFQDLLGDCVFIDIDLPTPEERAEIWNDIAAGHPSMRSLNRAELVKLTENLARVDIYTAAKEAIEDTYRESLRNGRYAPVSRSTIFEKIASFQPLDSDEYKQLEDAIVVDFGYHLGLYELEEQFADDFGRRSAGDE